MTQPSCLGSVSRECHQCGRPERLCTCPVFDALPYDDDGVLHLRICDDCGLRTCSNVEHECQATAPLWGGWWWLAAVAVAALVELVRRLVG